MPAPCDAPLASMIPSLNCAAHMFITISLLFAPHTYAYMHSFGP